MAQLTQRDIQKFAEAVATDLVEQQIPLNDSIRKIAEARGLNADQIGRVCEASNNLTFNKLLTAKHKTASDGLVEFDIADTKGVLGGIVKSAAVKTASAPAVALYELRELRMPVEAPPIEKVAHTEPAPTKRQLEANARTVRKTLDYLRHEKLGAVMEYQDSVRVIRNEFRKIDVTKSFASLEKEAAALYGEDVYPVLTDLRSAFGMESVEYDQPAIEKQAGYVDDTDPMVVAVKEAKDAYHLIERISTAMTSLEKSL